VTDEEAKQLMLKYAHCGNASEFQALPIEKRNKYLCKYAIRTIIGGRGK